MNDTFVCAPSVLVEDMTATGVDGDAIVDMMNWELLMVAVAVTVWDLKKKFCEVPVRMASDVA